MSQKECLIMCDVLDKIHDLSYNAWRNSKDISDNDLNNDTISNYESISVNHYPINDRNMDDIIKDARETKIILINERFYLPPLDCDKEFIPIMSVNCNYNVTPIIVQIRIGLYKYQEDSKQQIMGFGYRFEKHDESNHEYFHAQLTKTPHTEIKKCISPTWVAEHLPCLLMPANNSVSLLFCILIGFYGKKIVQRFIAPLNVDKIYKEPLKFIT